MAFVIVVLWGGSAHAGATVRPLLILGDSLSAGYGISDAASWPRLLAARMSQAGYRHSVVNASISGETTAGGARRIAQLLTEHKPAVVVIALGANDGLRGIAVSALRENLSLMIRAAKRAGAEVVLMKVRLPPNYGPRYSTEFEAVFDQIASSEAVIYAPFMLEAFAADPAAFQSDGLHPVAAAQPRILDTLWASLNDALSRTAVEARLH